MIILRRQGGCNCYEDESKIKFVCCVGCFGTCACEAVSSARLKCRRSVTHKYNLIQQKASLIHCSGSSSGNISNGISSSKHQQQ